MQCGYNTDEMLNIFKKYSKKIKYIDFINILKIILGFFTREKIIINGLNSGKQIEKIFNNLSSKKNINKISEIKIPLLIPSVDIHNGKIYFFTSKINRSKISDEIIYNSNINIGKAVRASCSYPAIFSPCKYDNTELIDGGIRENVPWKEIKKMGADKTLCIVFEKELDGKCCKNIIEVIKNSMDIFSHELAIYELEGADYLLKIKTKKIALLDNKQIDYLYNLGYKCGKENIKNIINNKINNN